MAIDCSRRSYIPKRLKKSKSKTGLKPNQKTFWSGYRFQSDKNNGLVIGFGFGLIRVPGQN